MGENERYNPWSSDLSTHAEINALNKLKDKKINLKRKKFDLLVVRLSKTERLGESRPCYHCLHKLEQSGVKIQNIYYSTRDNIIVKEKFNQMKESEKTTFSSGYRRSMARSK